MTSKYNYMKENANLISKFDISKSCINDSCAMETRF